MVWAGVSEGGHSDFLVLHGRASTVVNYRDEILAPYVKQYAGAINEEFILMDDNALPHRARLVEEHIEDEGLERRDWPAESLDLNPTEQVWVYLGKQWDLVCSKRWLPVIVLTAFNASGLFGQCACLLIAKKFGKRVLFFSALLMQSASGVATAFSPNFICFAVFRCLAGLAIHGVLIAPSTLAHELNGWKLHSRVSLLCSAARSIGMVLLAGIVLFVGDWPNLALASSIPFLAFFLYSW
ncbi:Solute carrier family 22 member 6-B [Araneus ventricosus]|uniref:Solute carrier family 22 member 6-B n=1 Tax=Araneus ventricosus TaxID=182803 RepID=A0A4Y2MEL3_ARAVE|nr:Solute carrier family 22 member 6-B [Araneus ventricosus]